MSVVRGLSQRLRTANAGHPPLVEQTIGVPASDTPGVVDASRFGVAASAVPIGTAEAPELPVGLLGSAVATATAGEPSEPEQAVAPMGNDKMANSDKPLFISYTSRASGRAQQSSWRCSSLRAPRLGVGWPNGSLGR